MNRGREVQGGYPPVKKSKEAEIVRVGRATIFGVHHDAKLPSGFRLQQLKEQFKAADHLLMEGDIDMLGTMNTRNPQSYEDIAVSVFNFKNKREDILWLEQGADLRSLADDYGINQRIFMAFMTSGSINDVVGKTVQRKFPNGKGMEKYARELAARVKLKAARTSPISEDDIFEAIDQNAKSRLIELTFYHKEGINPKYLLEDLSTADYEMMKYLGYVRDYEVMGPRVAQIATDLPNELAVVVGKFHIPAMKAALRGLPIERPLPWDEYKQTLEQEVQEEVEVFEKVALRVIT